MNVRLQLAGDRHRHLPSGGVEVGEIEDAQWASVRRRAGGDAIYCRLADLAGREEELAHDRARDRAQHVAEASFLADQANAVGLPRPRQAGDVDCRQQRVQGGHRDAVAAGDDQPPLDRGAVGIGEVTLGVEELGRCGAFVDDAIERDEPEVACVLSGVLDQLGDVVRTDKARAVWETYVAGSEASVIDAPKVDAAMRHKSSDLLGEPFGVAPACLGLGERVVPGRQDQQIAREQAGVLGLGSKHGRQGPGRLVWRRLRGFRRRLGLRRLWPRRIGRQAVAAAGEGAAQHLGNVTL